MGRGNYYAAFVNDFSTKYSLNILIFLLVFFATFFEFISKCNGDSEKGNFFFSAQIRTAMSNEDLNKILLETKTSTLDEIDPLNVLSEEWSWKGKKSKKGGKKHVGTTRGKMDASETSNFSLQPVKSEVNNTVKEKYTVEKQQKEAAAAAAVMAHSVLEYVFVYKLGSRVNAAKEKETIQALPPGLLYAERAQLRPTATHEKLSYVMRRGLVELEPHPHLLREEMPEELVCYRQSLKVCHWERDVTGGATGPLSAAVRNRVKDVIEAGLHGKEWQRKEASVDDGIATSTPEEVKSLNLFGTTSNTEVEEEASIQGGKNFSLDQYLECSDSDD